MDDRTGQSWSPGARVRPVAHPEHSFGMPRNVGTLWHVLAASGVFGRWVRCPLGARNREEVSWPRDES